MHQGDIIKDADPQLMQVLASGVFEEIFVLRAEYVGLSEYRGLHHDDVIQIAHRRYNERVQNYDFGGMLEELNIVED
jgi:hypothetical protein